MTPDSISGIYVRSEDTGLVLEARAVSIGGDILVYIWGGDRPHIGAVAAAQPRPSLADENRRSATCSVLTYLGHKEDEVVKLVAEHLSAVLDTHVVVTAGIHWDGLSQAGIGAVRTGLDDIIRQLTVKLKKQERIA